MSVVPVVRDGFALDGKYGNAFGGNGGSGVILRGEYVAGSPADFGTQSRERFDQNGRLNGHVQTAGNTGALQRLSGGVFLADGHQTGHFRFGDANFLAAPVGQANVGNDVVCGCAHLAHLL